MGRSETATRLLTQPDAGLGWLLMGTCHGAVMFREQTSAPYAPGSELTESLLQLGRSVRRSDQAGIGSRGGSP